MDDTTSATGATPQSDAADGSRPVIRLRPRTDARAITRGFPWVYTDQVVADRRTLALPPGTVAVLEDAARRPLGCVAVNMASKIACRMLDRDPEARIDAAWFRTRLVRALAHRVHLHDASVYRLVHAEADGLPGVVIDRFGEACVVQPNAAWADARIDLLVEALVEATGVGTVVVSGSGRARTLEGLDDSVTVMRGTLDGPVPVVMNGATYLADLTGGQKTGLFLDQRPNHALAARLARGGTVLDVFSHVGGFGLAALAGGATTALAVDGSAPALDLAQRGAALGGVADRFATRRGDAFAAMEALASEGASYGTVICDPPAFAPGKPAREAGLRAYERVARLAAQLVAPNGYLVLCSCSHAVDIAAFRDACARGIGRAGRAAQIVHEGQAGPDHPVLPQLAESGYLKAIFVRLMP